MRNLTVVALAVSMLCCALLPANATIGIAYQLQLGNPSNATADTNNHNHYLIQREVEALDYSDNLGQPVWASWSLTSGDVGGATRQPNYFPDTNLPPNFYRVTDNDYNGVGGINYNRGHLCPSEDRTDTDPHNDMLFFMSNIMPQAADNNQGVWGDFEGDCRTLAAGGNEILIMCGPSGFGTYKIPSGKAYIASHTWKIAVVVPLGPGMAVNRITAATRIIALKIPNSNGVSSVWQNYVTSAKLIQADTGFNFFSALPSNLAWVLRSKVDGQTPPAPANIGFSPTNGQTNSNVVITGTNLDTTTNVTFNGTTVSSFVIDSPTQLTALVPFGATSGQISIKGIGGTLTTSSNFTVNGSSGADPTIIASHTGSFTQGQVGATYTIIVTNVGALATAGTVTVADALPGSLTATSITGTGWTPDLGTLTCTRSDALVAGGSYPPITITVNVSGVAPASVTNSVTVSGGGDVNLANNTVIDPTVINPSGAPTIANQPQPQAVNVGQSALFSVTANGNAPLGYQWQFNGSPIVGASLSSYTKSNVQLVDGGNYSVVVSNSVGTLTSSNALLTVIPPGASTNILAQWNFNSAPPDADTGTGSTAPVVGSGTLVIVGGVSQTYFAGSTTDPAPSADNSGLSTASYPSQGTGNKTAGVRFNLSTLGYQNIKIRWDQRLSNTAGKYFRFQYTTNGTDFVDYNVVTIINTSTSFEAKTNDLSGLPIINNNANFGFRIVAEFESTATGAGTAGYVSSTGSGYSTGGTVRYDMMTIYGSPIPAAIPPSITGQPVNQVAVAGSVASFDVTATGTAPLGYQWKFNSSDLIGATNSSLVLSNVTGGFAGIYSVVVTNSAGSMTSSNATLAVYATAAATLSSFSHSGAQAYLEVTGVPGYDYAIQVSTNLFDWTSVLTNSSPFFFTDTNVVNSPLRFYRSVYLP